MARVRATQVRNVTQYKDEAGHRLPSRKGLWWENFAGYYEAADCPKCPEPEPEPEPVECGSSWHRMSRDDLQNSTVNYCPQCGKRLREA